MKDKKFLQAIFFFASVLLLAAYLLAAFPMNAYAGSYDSILESMSQKISYYESEGYDASRFRDIYEESKKDEKDIEMLHSKFMNLSKIFDGTVSLDDDISVARQGIMMGGYHFDEDAYGYAKELLKIGRYEEANLLLSNISYYMSGIVVNLSSSSGEMLDVMASFFEKVGKKSLLLEGYEGAIVAAGEDFISVKTLHDELVVVQQSEMILEDIWQKKEDFVSSGISALMIDDLFEEAVLSFERRRFTRLAEISEKVTEFASQKESIDSEYAQVKDDVAGIGDEALSKKLADAHNTYAQAEFDAASKSLASIKEEVLEQRSRSILDAARERPTILGFLRDNRQIIAMVLASLVLVFLSALLIFQGRIRARRKRLLLEGKKSLMQSIKDAQYEYYAKKSISKRMYDQKLDMAQKKIGRVVKELALLENDDKNT
jgi:hypothetical protein